MNDQQIAVALVAAVELAAVVRDGDPVRTGTAAQRLLDACGGDPVAAVSIVASIAPENGRYWPWWEDDIDADELRIAKFKRDAVEAAIARGIAVDRILVDCGVSYAEFKSIKATMNRAARGLTVVAS